MRSLPAEMSINITSTVCHDKLNILHVPPHLYMVFDLKSRWGKVCSLESHPNNHQINYWHISLKKPN